MCGPSVKPGDPIAVEFISLIKRSGRTCVAIFGRNINEGSGAEIAFLSCHTTRIIQAHSTGKNIANTRMPNGLIIRFSRYAEALVATCLATSSARNEKGRSARRCSATGISVGAGINTTRVRATYDAISSVRPKFSQH